MRHLAHEAHRLLSGPGTREDDAREILQRIDDLREELGEGVSEAVRRWLENLRREVEGA